MINQERRRFIGKTLGLAGLVIAPIAFLEGCASQTIKKVEEPWFVGFVCNYWEDKNGNGFGEDGEFIGIKDHFRANERITLLGWIRGKKGFRLTTKLWNGQGKLIYTSDEIIPYNYGCVAGVGIDPWGLYEEGGIGDYTTEWYLNDNLIEVKNFSLRK